MEFMNNENQLEILAPTCQFLQDVCWHFD
jgi:hypothetical protein